MVEKLVEISIINSLVVSLILRGYTKLNKNTINVASELSTIHCVTTLSKGRRQKKKTSYSVTLSLKVGGG